MAFVHIVRLPADSGQGSRRGTGLARQFASEGHRAAATIDVGRRLWPEGPKLDSPGQANRLGAPPWVGDPKTLEKAQRAVTQGTYHIPINGPSRDWPIPVRRDHAKCVSRAAQIAI
jgi:hypothetical protein